MGEGGEEELGIGKGDKLILRGLKFHGFHGVKEEEKKLGHKFLVDVDAWLDLRKARKTDCLSDTVSYTAIYRRLLKDGLMFLCLTAEEGLSVEV
ncbi:hypothetical protein AAC387_Pa06g3155 [Persea americana]